MKEPHRTIIVPKGKILFITVPGMGDIGSLAGPALIKINKTAEGFIRDFTRIESSKKRRRFDQDHLEEIKERVRNK